MNKETEDIFHQIKEDCKIKQQKIFKDKEEEKVEVNAIEANLQMFFPYVTQYKRAEFGNKMTFTKKVNSKTGDYKAILEITVEKGQLFPNITGGKVLLAFFEIIDKEIKEQGKLENPIRYHRAEIAKICGIKGNPNQKIKEAVKGLHTLHFHSYGIWKNKKDGKFLGTKQVSHDFYLIPSIKDVTIKDAKGKEITQYSEISFCDELLDNYNKGNLAKIDRQYALGLNSPLGIKIYLYFDKLFYTNDKGQKKDCIPISYKRLCSQLQMKEEKEINERIRQFKEVLTELKDTGFLGSFKWVRENKSLTLSIWKGRRYQIEEDKKEQQRRKYRINKDYTEKPIF